MTVLHAVTFDVPPALHFWPTPQVSDGVPQVLAPQSSGTTVATGHCLVQTVHSAGFVQPGSQPIGRFSSATGQTFEQVEHDGSDVVLFIFAGSQKSVRVVCVKKFAFAGPAALRPYG